MPVRLLIADPDAAFVGTLREALLRRREFQIVGIARNGQEALLMAQRLRPDELLLSAFLPGMDGISLAREVLQLPHPPVCVMCTCYLPDVLTGAILQSGVFYLLYKPQPPERVVQVLLRCAEWNGIAPAETEQDGRCASRLQSLGIPLHSAGYRYLLRAVELCREKSERIRNLSGWLYREVAAEFHVTAEQVERGIRHSVRAAYLQGGIMREEFAARPGNREFLQYLIRKTDTEP